CLNVRFNATDLLERARNGRIVFAGDSIGRNQWESLLCMLAQGVSNISTIYEVNGNPITKHRGFLVMRFSDYNLTVEYYRLPFLVFFGRPQVGSPPEVKMGIQVDQLHWFSKSWVGADVIVFNTGHWWNEYKTTNM
ncbi:Protein trichome birefringence-like 8, partial [Linum perenne]